MEIWTRKKSEENTVQERAFFEGKCSEAFPEQLVALQAEIKQLSDEFDRYYADWLGAKVRFVKLTEKFTSNVAAPTQQEIPQDEASAQPTEEYASNADENQAADEPASVRSDDCIPASDDSASATTSVAPEEITRPTEASAVVPEEIAYTRATTSVVPK